MCKCSITVQKNNHHPIAVNSTITLHQPTTSPSQSSSPSAPSPPHHHITISIAIAITITTHHHCASPSPTIIAITTTSSPSHHNHRRKREMSHTVILRPIEYLSDQPTGQISFDWRDYDHFELWVCFQCFAHVIRESEVLERVLVFYVHVFLGLHDHSAVVV